VLIDWFTVAAQILNFLILVGLLKKFLYGPIIRAMDEREAKIAERLEEARRRSEAAQREADEYSRRNQELDAKRAEMLQEAKAKAEQLRKDLVEQARSEVEERKIGWQETIRREQQTFLKDLRRQAGEKILAISRQALKDLANRQMERQVVEVFLEALERTDYNEMKGLDYADGEKEAGITVSSAFKLQEDLRNRLVQKIEQWVGGPAKVEFEESKELLSGIELKSNGRKITWNLKDYLDSLEQSMHQILEQERENSKAQNTNPS
jgi:F-type H+-transporting ATPase subunit b